VPQAACCTRVSRWLAAWVGAHAAVSQEARASAHRAPRSWTGEGPQAGKNGGVQLQPRTRERWSGLCPWERKGALVSAAASSTTTWSVQRTQSARWGTAALECGD